VRHAVIVALSALLLAVTWYYAPSIVPQYQVAEQKQTGEPRASIISDLYPRWFGTRELLIYRADPYSLEMTRRIQAGLYGPGSDLSKVRDQQAFAYPVYVALFLAPFANVRFATVATVFTFVLLLCIVATAWLWSRIIELHWRSTTVISIVLLACASLAAVQGVQLQNLSLLVALLLTAAVAVMTTNRLVLAGVLLALATIKPQLALPFAGWLVLWATGDWSRRWRIVAAFSLTLAVLTLSGELMLRGWTTKFFHAVLYYRSYNAPSIVTILLGGIGGIIVTLALILAVAVTCWRKRYAEAGSRAFAFATALVLAATLVATPTVSLYNQVLLIPAFLLFVAHRRVWLNRRLAKSLWQAAWLLIAAPWVLIVGLVAAHFAGVRLAGNALVPLPYYIHIATPIVCTVLLMIGAVHRPSNATA
jgi:Glycosyltransferase family 87